MHDLPTPALVLDHAAFEANLTAMAGFLPGPRLRPHVKAHKCTSIAAAQARHGHTTFTCATPREMVGMARAGRMTRRGLPRNPLHLAVLARAYDQEAHAPLISVGVQRLLLAPLVLIARRAWSRSRPVLAPAA